MAEPQRPSPDELTLATRNALVQLLLADLASLEGDGAVRGLLRRPDGDDAAPWVRTAVARERLQRYAAALDQAPRGDDLATRLAQARVLFAHALYFEVHEILEPPWRTATGERRRYLQGIIQAAVAWHHGAGARPGPALRASAAAAAKLSAAPAEWGGFPVARLCTLLAEYRGRLARGESPPPRVRL